MLATCWGGDSTLQGLWWLHCELWQGVSVCAAREVQSLRGFCAFWCSFKGFLCFLMAGTDSGAQGPSGFWLGSLLSAKWLQPDVSDVLATALCVRQALVKGVQENLLVRKGIREKCPPGLEQGG